jgi:RNA polymerase sigma-70 factor (family 1)
VNLSVQDILFCQNRVAYARDQQAYRQLFFHFHRPLYRFAFNITGDNEAADELVSDTMMKIWDLGSKLAQVNNLNAYLFTAVKNAAFTWMKKQKQAPVSLDESEAGQIDAKETPEQRLILSETEQLIESAISSLPAQCQLVYRLIKEEGFSYKEVTGILEISQNSIETHMRIALKKIRAALTSYLLEKK